MSVDEEKKFVIKHDFTNFRGIANGGTINGKEEEHFGIPWRISAQLRSCVWEVYLECLNPCDFDDWSIETTVKFRCSEETRIFTNTGRKCPLTAFTMFASTDNVTVEITVKINKINGNFGLKKDRSFDKSNKEFSDVVLKINDEKFYVSKSSLAYHSTYFKSLFLGNFEESQQSEVELKDINPQDFQNYLELIHGESTVKDGTVDGILHLADFFDSKTAIRRCEDFLMKNSQKTLKEKFVLANKYKLGNLMEECLSELKTNGGFRSIIPENANDLSPEMWKKLFEKSLSYWK